MTKLVALPIPFGAGENQRIIYPVIASEAKHTVLIDTGFPGQLPLIQEKTAKFGIALENLTHIVITHHDIDHVGSLAALKRMFPQVQVVSSAIEADYINGSKKSPRLEFAEQRAASLQPAEQQGMLAYVQMLKSVERIKVDKTFKEGELLPCFRGILIISTPGHLLGHISLYFEKEKTLITGDAMTMENGKVAMPNPQYTLNMAQARESVQKFLKYDIEKIICYHGGVFEGDGHRAIEEALANS
jgi:glyoxylase-like metal-dependent hydrolase (beta-lactamase superfamily II)